MPLGAVFPLPAWSLSDTPEQGFGGSREVGRWGPLPAEQQKELGILSCSRGAERENDLPKF